LTNLPNYHTAFIGYQVELAQIAARLDDPDCRLLSLVGPGGAGKTRLAVQAAQLNSSKFPGGVVFVPLAGLQSTEPDATEWMAETVARKVDTRFNEPTSEVGESCVDWRQILAEHGMLIILDHYEHLLPYTDLLHQILNAGPGVKLLVTSRQPLGLPNEWLLEIKGLAFPSQERVPEAHTFDSVRLFAQSAVRLQTKFTLSRENLPAVARICRLVHGNPLAIEIAAAWLSDSTPSQIVAQIAVELESLAASRLDLAEHQRRAWAVVDKTWDKLTPAEQAALKRAAIFRGGFNHQAARAILAMEKGTQEKGALEDELEGLLGTLVEKALLLEVEEGRFDLQPLVAQYATERLEADPGFKQRLESWHADFFKERLKNLEAENPGEQMNTAGDLQQEIDNLRQAWGWGVAHADITVLGESQGGLAIFYTQCNLTKQGAAAFQSAANAIRPLAAIENPGGKRKALLAELYMQLGRFQLRLGKSEEASKNIQEAIQLARALHDPKLQSNILKSLGDLPFDL
jgi:predicted ATPase